MISGIRKIIQSLEQAYTSRIETQFNYTPYLLSIAQELDILRIVQEALTNACKHSQGSYTFVGIKSDPVANHLSIRIEDNGIGFDQNQDYSTENHWGIHNIKKRVIRLNATLTIESTPGNGTTILLKIPIEAGGKKIIAR